MTENLEPVDRYLDEKRAKRRHRVRRYMTRPVMSTYLKTEVLGEENVKGLEGAFILVPNHSSHLDAPMVFSLLPDWITEKLATGAAADYFYRKRGISSLTSVFFNTYPILRKGKRESVEHSKAAGMTGRLLRAGVPILVFPEGTRSRSGKIGQPKAGAAALAMQVGVPIVPIAMLGGHDADGDHVNDLKFNRYLLIGLAEHLDDIDLDDVTAEMHKSQFYSRAGMVLPDGCTDPMAGVLDAMGNNRFAALGYLAPTANDGSVDTSRVAAASCLRTSALGAQSERAAQLAGHAIHGLGSRTGDKTDLYNDDALRIGRTGLVVAYRGHDLFVRALALRSLPRPNGHEIRPILGALRPGGHFLLGIDVVGHL